MFYAKTAMRGACTSGSRRTRKRLGTRLRQGYGGQAAGAYLVQAPENYVWPLGEGRAVPMAYSPMRRHAVLHPNSDLSEKGF